MRHEVLWQRTDSTVSSAANVGEADGRMAKR